MDLFEDEREVGTDAVSSTKDKNIKTSNNQRTYFTVAISFVLIGGLVIWLGLPFMSIISATNTPMTTNAIIVNPTNNGSVSDTEFQEINMTVDGGWLPGRFVVKTGVPVRWNVYIKRFGGCINGLRSTDLGIEYQFETTGITKTFEFTPTKAGTIYFTCLMGMATGRIEVRDDVTVANAATINAAAATNQAQKVGGCGCGGRNSCGIR